MSDEWREYLYGGTDEQSGYTYFVIPKRTASNLPATCDIIFYNVGSATSQLNEAYLYWQIRERWRTLGVEAFGALYMKWAPKRDAILGKEEHLGKSRSDWERFYLALADERAAREYLAGRAKAAFGSELVGAYMNESERVGKMQQGGRAG